MVYRIIIESLSRDPFERIVLTSFISKIKFSSRLVKSKGKIQIIKLLYWTSFPPVPTWRIKLGPLFWFLFLICVHKLIPNQDKLRLRFSRKIWLSDFLWGSPGSQIASPHPLSYFYLTDRFFPWQFYCHAQFRGRVICSRQFIALGSSL